MTGLVEAAGPRTDDLRRRLYQPQATEDDLRRFLAVRDAVPAVVVVPLPATGPRRDPRRPRRPWVLAGVLVLAVGVGIVATAAPRPSTAPRTTGAVLLTVHRTMVLGERIDGTGSATVPVDTTSAPGAGGLLVVAIASPFGDPIGWRARTGPARRTRTVLVGEAVARPAAASPTVTAYPGAAPDRIAVQAAPDARWTLVVAFMEPRWPR